MSTRLARWLGRTARAAACGAAAWMAMVGTSRDALAQPPTAAPVVVAPVQSQSVEAAQSYVGTVMPLRASAVGSAVDGRVVEYPVREGRPVNKGQPLAQLLTESLGIEVAAARAELDLREQELAELNHGSRPEEIEQARARMLGAKALMDYTQAKYERARQLREQGRVVTQDELEESLSSSVQARQAYLESQALHTLAVEGPRKEKIAQAQARVAMQAQQVRRLEDQIAKHTIRAPFDGYMVAEHTQVGEWVQQGQVVAEVVQIDEVDVVVYVPEQYVPYLVIGAESRVQLPALPGEAFVGKVVEVVPRAKSQTRTFPVKVRLANRQGKNGPLLKAGMFAMATLSVGQRETVLLVPKDALVLGGPKPTLFVIEGQQAGPGKEASVRAVPVELGTAEGNRIQVRGELSDASLVVVQGNERLRPGQKVVIERQVSESATVGRPAGSSQPSGGGSPAGKGRGAAER